MRVLKYLLLRHTAKKVCKKDMSVILPSTSAMQPLFVDTNIEYELDMSRFPEWDDLETRYQPTLLLHQPDAPCPCTTTLPYNTEFDLYSLLDTSFSDCDLCDGSDFIEEVIDNISTNCTAHDVPPLHVESNTEPCHLSNLDRTDDVFSDFELPGCLPTCFIDSKKRKLSDNNDDDSQVTKRQRFYSDDLFMLLSSVFFSVNNDSDGVSGDIKKETLCRGS